MVTTSWHEVLNYPTQWIPQGTTARYTVQLTDEARVALTLTQVTTVTLTIYDLDATPPTVLIPVRDVKNVPANGGAVSSSGLLTLTLSPTDNALLDETRSYERRRWTLIWSHAGGTKMQHMDIDRVIANTIS